MKRYLPVFIILLATALIIFVAPYTEWNQCQICGVQQWDRGICRTKIAAWSVEEFDEFGTYAQWKELNHTNHCEHQYEPVEHKTPKMTLEELGQH
jgi:hypothetical protein